MTDEQAIVYLESLKEYVDKIAYAPDMYGAIDKAIQALEQEPCEDCISREEAIRIAEQGQIQGYEWQIRKLCTLPSVTPKRPKGKWIPIHPLQEDDDGAYMCSCCRVGNWGIDPKVDKYCFNCGTEMVGDEE